MTETQESVGLWADAVFPGPNREVGVRSQALKLVKEAAELAMACGWNRREIVDAVREEAMKREDSGLATVPLMDWRAIPGEAADVAVVLNVLAHRASFDLGTEVGTKMAVNRARSWNVTPEGMAQHVPAGESR